MPNEMPTQTTATRETFLRAAVAAYNLAPGSLWAKSPNHLVLRSRAGYLPAYHMNRAGWIGLLLDGSLPLEEVLALLQKSYEAAGSKAARRIADGPRTVPHCLAHALREDG